VSRPAHRPSRDAVFFADAGALIAYGPSLPALYRRAACDRDKILEGAKPSDLPIDQSTRFDLVVNLKAAESLGLTIPRSVL
jgi:putative ABC transport system substrate-binding protein